jgi:hypothetical protein
MVASRLFSLLSAGFCLLSIVSCTSDTPAPTEPAAACGCTSPALGTITQASGTARLQKGHLTLFSTAAATSLSAAQLGGSDLELTACELLPPTDVLGPEGGLVPVTFSGQLHHPCPGANSQAGYQPYMLTLSSLSVVPLPVPTPAIVATNVSWPLPCSTAVVLPHEEFPGSLPCSVGSLDIGQARNFVVQSQEAFIQIYATSYTRCSRPIPTIDFSRYTLLIGEKKTAQLPIVVGQRVAGCPDGTYTYSVEINKGMAAVGGQVSYAVLVPKLPATASVVFDVQVTP